MTAIDWQTISDPVPVAEYAVTDSPSERIRQYRRGAKMKQFAVGQRLSPPRTQAAVSDIERGRTRMTVELADQFAAIFGVERWDILGCGPRSVETPPQPTWEQQRDALVGALVLITNERDEWKANRDYWVKGLSDFAQEARKTEDALAAMTEGQRVMAAALNEAHAERDRAWREVDHWRRRAWVLKQAVARLRDVSREHQRCAEDFEDWYTEVVAECAAAQEQVAWLTYAIIQAHNGQPMKTRAEWEQERNFSLTPKPRSRLCLTRNV